MQRLFDLCLNLREAFPDAGLGESRRKEATKSGLLFLQLTGLVPGGVNTRFQVNNHSDIENCPASRSEMPEVCTLW